MGSFLKRGKRTKVKEEKRLVKQHMKAMYAILGEIKEIAKDIHNSKLEWSEDNIIELAAQFTDRKIADMEKFLLLGNLQMLKDEAEPDNT